MTRETDLQTHDPAQIELGHVYDRLSKLESGQDEMRRTLHAVQLKLAEGNSFPWWARGLLATFLLQFAGAVWWAASIDARVDSMPQLQERLTSAFQGMRNSDAVVTTIQAEHLRMRQELDLIQKRTIEGTDDRWRKRDDIERMAELQRYLDAVHERTNARFDKIERRNEERDRWWQRLWESRVLKEGKQ